MVSVVVLVREDLVVVCLAAAPTSGARGDARVHDDVVVAALVVAHEVLAAAENHEVLRVVEILRAIVVIDRPDAVVPIDEEILGDQVVLQNSLFLMQSSSFLIYNSSFVMQNAPA